MAIKRSLLLLMIGIGLTTTIFSQSVSVATAREIDNLFANWNATNSPGCVIGIVRNDTLIYSKGYGMANLEYDISNTPATLFHIASVSKQFTAWAIILLARQNKIHLDDDIHRYLPWFPDMKAKITVRNLLNHTSGIRDQWQLVAMSGTKLEDVITQDQIINILSKQRSLNFMPGEQYLYSSSGYTMLAEIVKSVTGQTLRQFSDSAIFKPLGMSHTHIHDDYTQIEKNRSYSYTISDGKNFSNSILNYGNSGATSLFTNVNDMSKWVMNFYDHKSGDQKDIDTLTKNLRLNNGMELSYASGIIANTYKGWRQFSHAGTDAGYQTYLTVFPDLKMGFFVFSNLTEFDTQSKVYAMADLFIQDKQATTVGVIQKPRDSLASIIKDTLAIQKFLGDYIGADGLPVNFDRAGNQMYYHLFGQAAFLIQDTKNSFSIAAMPEVKFTFTIKGTDSIVRVQTPDQIYYLKKYKMEAIKTDKMLQAYIGTYYSPELDSRYTIELKEHELLLTNLKSTSKLAFLNKDHLMTDYWWMGHLQIIRDQKNMITGFEVNSNGVMHLKFNKVSIR